ncbi:LAFE_0H09450g1_1 [Lachancea fermentati]|uniref:LAFE_0H09450g1_1 n=1 Tax=Lachancea fermentati TaxID=4955 RepID=A0A1G4MK47_LACFM|nr:LAFE_0H09450g1_1 [Lachancea fermentati]
MTKVSPSIATVEGASSYKRTTDTKNVDLLGSYTESLNVELLERGRRDLRKILESVKGQLTQAQYELILTESLTLDTLMSTSDKLHSGNTETKYLLLKRRYYVDPDGIVRDHKKHDSVVCEPDLMFDLIMGNHLQNEHVHWRKLHKDLRAEYANVTRAFVQMSTRYCSKCNPKELVKPFKKFKHANIYKGLMPLERIHIEIFSPFEKLIEGKYSHVLYLRDYHSRFVWLLPLKNSSSQVISSSLASFLLSLPRIPIFLETSTLNRRELFEICQTIAIQFELYIGLGLSNSRIFQRNGIDRIQYLLRLRKDDCLNDWNMCLKHGSHYNNSHYNTGILGMPKDLIFSSLDGYAKQFELKREKILDELFSHNVVILSENGKRRGLIYVEDERDGFIMEDEEYIAGDEEFIAGDQDLPSGDQESRDALTMNTPSLEPSISHKNSNVSKRTRTDLDTDATMTRKKSRSTSVIDMSEEISGPSSSFFQQVGNSLETKAGPFEDSVEL